MNHGFINPVDRKIEAEIKAVMGEDFSPYFRASSPAENYDSQFLNFTEMLNWALFSVYVRDTQEESVATEIAKHITANMVESRGFTRFEPFQTALLEISASPDTANLTEAITRLATTDAKRWTVH